MRAIVIAAAMLAAAPAAGQAPAPASPDDDLKCAAWSAFLVGINKDKPDVVARLSSGLTWFLGRYEAATGKPFEQALTAEYVTRVAPDMVKIEDGCKARMLALGTRLQSWGQALKPPATSGK